MTGRWVPVWTIRAALLGVAIAILLVARRLVPDIGYLPRLIAIGLILVGALWLAEIVIKVVRRRMGGRVA
jgi:hypothetical protein